MSGPHEQAGGPRRSGAYEVTMGQGQDRASANLMEPIDKLLQLRLEFTSVSATVPKLFGQASLLARLRGGRVAAKQSRQDSERQVRRF